MRIGLRLQLLAAMALLLALAFVPLWRAIAQVTEHALRAESQLGREQVAELLADAAERDGGLELAAARGASACLYGPRGELVDAAWVGCERAPTPGADRVVVPRAHVTLVLWSTGEHNVRAEAVVRLARLYTVLFALALLAFVYAALTALVVRPIEALAAAARKVQRGDVRFDLPALRAAELQALGESLGAMTEALRSNERQLADKLDELSRATANLTSARHEIAEGERLASVGRLAAGVAHEIGNPLTAIFGLSDLIAGGGLAEDEIRDFAGRIRRESERAHHTIRDLLDFARAKPTGDERAHADASTRVEHVVRQVLGLLRPQRGFRDIEVELEIEPELAVRMVEARLVQVLLNLALNAQDALAAAREGRGTLRVRARAESDRVSIEVQDDGPGVPAEVRERLFEPFVTTKEPGRGTGLGLAVCRSLVEAAGGTLRLGESERGARFCIDLPRA